MEQRTQQWWERGDPGAATEGWAWPADAARGRPRLTGPLLARLRTTWRLSNQMGGVRRAEDEHARRQLVAHAERVLRRSIPVAAACWVAWGVIYFMTLEADAPLWTRPVAFAIVLRLVSRVSTTVAAHRTIMRNPPPPEGGGVSP